MRKTQTQIARSIRRKIAGIIFCLLCCFSPAFASFAQVSSAPAVLRYRDLKSWYGLRVREIRFEGVSAEEAGILPLALKTGDRLSAANVRGSLHELYATGLYRDVVAEGVESGGEVIIIFRGTPQLFLHRLFVRGMKQDLLAAQIQRSTRLDIGEPFTSEELDEATVNLKAALARNGFYQPTVFVTTVPAGPQHLVDVIYTVDAGKQATVGTLTVTGSPGVTVPRFRKVGKLKEGSKVTSNTVPRALSRLRKSYQKQDRLEATVRADQQIFRPAPAQVDYGFDVNRGPLVRVVVNGAKVSKRDLKNLVPVYEEGAVDPDLLDEGDDNLRDHFQKQGYFNVRVTHTIQQPQANEEIITYQVERGPLHKVVAVHINGNRYFDKDVIRERLSVEKADSLNRHGVFSQALLESDVNAIAVLYRSNGFAKVRVVPVVKDSDQEPGGFHGKFSIVTVTYEIHEGVQQRIGKVQLVGAAQLSQSKLLAQMNTRPGEPYSLTTLAGDRLQLFADYYRHGFSQVELTFEEQPEKDDPDKIDITVRIHEGEPFFVNQVLISGLHYTKPQVVDKLLEIHPGDPLDRNAISDTQRRLYNLAVFNEVNTGIVNPQGAQSKKDVLLNLTEAHRWNYDYGFGFEVQTGTPQRNCPSAASLIELHLPPTFECNPNGKFGVSPRVSFDVSRINLGGRNRTITLQTAYGTLEQQAIMTFNVPQFYGHKTIDFSISGGYVSNQNVTTYEASTISGSVLFTQRPNKVNTLIYSMAYRYVYVNPNSLQVSAELIPLLSQPTRVSGPGFTYVHDTRDSPLNAASGWYLSAQEFFAWSGLASQANFNRLDTQESNYYRLNKRGWIFARSTRIGIENIYGDPTYDLVPLPERLYAGGATSHRGFSVNAAGPRDLQTGFPVGGSGAFVNSTELRVPPVPLPLIGSNLGFVLFEDFGNVYQNASDMFPALFRFHQPDVQTCYNVTPPSGTGTCNFNYDSQAAGLGLRYKTPVGPIRVDFSYNLNPTVYPVVADPALLPAVLNYNGEPPYVGNSGHFNFFFSIGQAF